MVTTRSTTKRAIPEPHGNAKVKRLRLHKETLRNLTDVELDNVRGGGRNTQTCTCRPRPGGGR